MEPMLEIIMPWHNYIETLNINISSQKCNSWNDWSDCSPRCSHINMIYAFLEAYSISFILWNFLTTTAELNKSEYNTWKQFGGVLILYTIFGWMTWILCVCTYIFFYTQLKWNIKKKICWLSYYPIWGLPDGKIG